MNRKTSFTVNIPTEDVIGMLEDARKAVVLAENAVSLAITMATQAAELAGLSKDADDVLTAADANALNALKALREALTVVACMIQARANAD